MEIKKDSFGLTGVQPSTVTNGIASSSSAPAVDYRLVLECLAELGQSITLKNGNYFVDCLHYFHFITLDAACEAFLRYYDAIKDAEKIAKRHDASGNDIRN